LDLGEKYPHLLSCSVFDILGKRNHTIDLPFSVSYCLKAVLVLGYENPSGLHFSVWIDIDIFAPVAVQCSVK
jgi:hypothetical protein